MDMKVLKKVGVGGSAITFLFMNFATFKYVDAKFDPVLQALKEVRKMIIVLDNRVYEMNGRRGDPPPKKE